ncbi:M61 family peptidase [Bradymonadaceae bacterium TMQ3]|nr:M61 family peptidase [Bradymonadaceae bacterium TMQ3]TXC76650.1 M61 family metallopeptidase [Bradymonadales bacterium TMQ1]
MSAPIAIRIQVPQPQTHLIEVEMRVMALSDDSELILRMPVWSPGSYLVREYARHVQRFAAFDKDGERLRFEKIDKTSWKIDVAHVDQVRVTYQVYAHDLTVRTNHVDTSHAFFNCVATCMYPDGRLDDAIDLHIVPPEGWEIFCGLAPAEGSKTYFEVADFDELFDTPVELGPHPYFDFEVEGVPHRFVMWGVSNADIDALKKHVPELVKVNARMFGEIPYERYVFINHLVDGGFGGLEHRHSSVNMFDARGFDKVELDEDGNLGKKYGNFLRLLCHEHFHAYHVKRLRPEALGPFDYQNENYTHDLWAVEGVTSYYDTYNMMGTGLLSPAAYVELLEKRVLELSQYPGRLLHSLEMASFDAWIKFYRPDENTRNSTVSYYLKGELVSWMLDLWIRTKTGGERDLADVLRKLYREHYKARDEGYPRGAFEAAVGEISGADPTEFFDRYIRGTHEIAWEEFLAPVGLRLKPVHDERGGASIKAVTRAEDDRRVVREVLGGGPGEQAGLCAGDVLVAIDRWEVAERDPDELLIDYEEGDVVDVHVLRRGRLHTLTMTLAKPGPKSYKLEVRADASQKARELRKGWLGVETW